MSKMSCKCGQLATWYYMPAEEEWACCDNCVPRGCSCNEYSTKIYYGDDDIVECEPEGKENIDFEWIDENHWRDLDNGKQIPCCEWWYDKEGWDNE